MKNKVFEYWWILIGIASFFLYSSQFYPWLNSDDALNILMIKDLQLPQDLYAWGQDRGGALIPLLGWPLHHILGFSVVLSESIVHFLILFAGFWYLSKFLKSNISKIIFAFLWFFPNYWFFSLIRFPFGIQYSLTAVVLFLVFIRREGQQNDNLKISRLILVLFMLSLAIWVSDLTLTSILALLTLVGFWIIQRKIGIPQLLKKPEGYITIAGAALTTLFILYAKNHAIKNELYSQSMLNSLQQTGESAVIIIKSLWNILIFRAETPMLSIFGILVILLMAILLWLRPKFPEQQQSIVKFFLIDGLILLIVILLSHWAFLNGDSRRYFSGIYVGVSMIMLMGIENLTGKTRKFMQLSALIIAIFSSLGGIHYLKYVYPKSLKPMINVVGEFKSLGKTGIIGEYWNSYISACPDPDRITAIPHDAYATRNPRLIKEVFSKPKLFIIKDMWMDKFPDSIMQYGYLLRKNGDSIKLANCVINEYKRVPKNQRFNPEDLMTIAAQKNIDSQSGKTIISADSGCLECRQKHLVYGPGISLGPGKFEIGFFLRADHLVSGKNIAVLDVTANFGTTKICDRILKSDEVTNGDYQYYWLEFENITAQKDMEFRILYLGNSSFYFDHLILRERL